MPVVPLMAILLSEDASDLIEVLTNELKWLKSFLNTLVTESYIIGSSVKMYPASSEFKLMWTLNRDRKKQNMQKRFVNNIEACINSKHSVMIWRFLFASNPFPDQGILAVRWFTVKSYLQPQLDATIPGTSLRTIVLSSS